jgi:hypothetical protein
MGGRGSGWRETEMREEWNRDALIEWANEPPPVVKCVLAYQRPVRVIGPGPEGQRKGNITG